jgi:hypothetical protein
VFRTPREVPEDVVMEIADRLRAFELEEERQMLRFELVCRQPDASASPSASTTATGSSPHGARRGRRPAKH